LSIALMEVGAVAAHRFSTIRLRAQRETFHPATRRVAPLHLRVVTSDVARRKAT
jgi:hypothetical protein